MTTQDWIYKTYQTRGNTRTFASVMADSNGNIYSYGYGYPLLFRVGSLNFINNAGYSNTTSKHIGWAWHAVGYDNAIPVQLPSRSSYHGAVSYTLGDMLHLLLDKQQSIVDTMKSKRRRDTQVYNMLVDELARTNKYIERIEQAI